MKTKKIMRLNKIKESKIQKLLVYKKVKDKYQLMRVRLDRKNYRKQQL